MEITLVPSVMMMDKLVLGEIRGKEVTYCCGVKIYVQLECGPMPNLMVALPNIGGALCSTPQSLADAHY